jgi:hypothetical protein
MAQDVAKTSLGKELVRQDDDGNLNLDTNNLLGVIVASLAHLNNKGK